MLGSLTGNHHCFQWSLPSIISSLRPSSLSWGSSWNFSQQQNRWTECKMESKSKPVFSGDVATESSKKKGGSERLKRSVDGSSSFNLRSLSKLILPPLGVSGYRQAQSVCRGKVISPMDSRYRLETRVCIHASEQKEWIVNYSRLKHDIPKQTQLSHDLIVSSGGGNRSQWLWWFILHGSTRLRWHSWTVLQKEGYVSLTISSTSSLQ